jgi:site-specific recombinase XerD
MLPVSFEPVLKGLAAAHGPDSFLFPGAKAGRYFSPRSVRNVMARAMQIAGIGKKASPHSLRKTSA